MKKIFNCFQDFDKILNFIFCFWGLAIAISLCIFSYNFSKNDSEKDCVDFYKKNNYILDGCEIYRDKLEGK